MTFSPPRSAISNITQANPAVVTTSTNNNLTTGQVVRLHVPNNYGMFQLNQQLFSITRISPTTFSLQYTQVPFVNVNSSFYPEFTIPSKPSLTAEVLAVGSGPTPINNVEWQTTNNLAVSLLEDQTINIATVNQPY